MLNNKGFNKNFNKGKTPTTKKTDDKIFSYPYNFVSLGREENIKRSEIKKGTNSGKIKCNLKNLTPLFIGNKDNSTKTEEFSMTLKIGEKEKYVVPASTIKGELRNIIEVLTTSCIKNVEDERLLHRTAAGKRKNVFGIIKKFPTDHDKGIVIIADKVKINREVLKKIQNGKYNKEGFYSGIKVNSLKDDWIKKAGINTKYPKGSPDPNAINTIKQFEELTRGGTNEAIIWYSSSIYGKMYEKLLILRDRNDPKNCREFTKDDYEDLKYLITQRKEIEEKKDKNFYIDKLKENDAIIFEDNNGKIKDFAFSEIPRIRYKYSPLELVPKNFRPCKEKDKLCFACRLFGTIGDNSKNDSSTKSHLKPAYASRVFISDAISIKEKNSNFEENLILKSLGEPHPSLTRFYLENEEGYDSDKTVIRGRKFYWHHSEKIKAGVGFKNYLKTISDNEKSNTNSRINLLKLQDFEFEVAFRDLTDDELGILLYSLELEGNMLHKFGKGKAFGLGSCKIEIKDCLMEASEKYNSFTKAYAKFDKNKYIEVAKKEYKLEENSDRKELKELKYIMAKENSLDFSEESFPEAANKKGEWNTLAWFVANKNKILPHILDYKNKK